MDFFSFKKGVQISIQKKYHKDEKNLQKNTRFPFLLKQRKKLKLPAKNYKKRTKKSIKYIEVIVFYHLDKSKTTNDVHLKP